MANFATDVVSGQKQYSLRLPFKCRDLNWMILKAGYQMVVKQDVTCIQYKISIIRIQPEAFFIAFEFNMNSPGKKRETHSSIPMSCSTESGGEKKRYEIKPIIQCTTLYNPL